MKMNTPEDTTGCKSLMLDIVTIVVISIINCVMDKK